MLSTEELSQIADQEDVPLSLLLATYHVESSSGNDPKSKVPHDKGIVGPFQVSPGTFKEMVGDGKDINNEYMNAVAGARYLKQGLDRYGGDVSKAYQYYHGGPNEGIWGPKTRAAAEKVVEYKNMLEQGQNSYTQTLGENMLSIAALSVDKTNSRDEFKILADEIRGDVDSAVLELNKSQAASEQFQQDYNTSAQKQIELLGAKAKGMESLYAAIAATNSRQAAGVANNLTRLGLDDEDMSNLAAHITTKMRQEAEQLLPMKAALDQKANAIPEVYQNPIGWLLGNLEIRKDIAVHNNLQSQLNQDKAVLDKLTGAAASLQSVNAAKTASGKAAQALAEGQIHIAEAQIAQQKVIEQAATQNLTFATRSFQNKIEIAKLHEAQLRVLESSAANEDRALGRQDAALDRQLKAEQRQAKIDADAANLEVFQGASELIGWPKLASMEAYNKMPAKQKQILMKVINNGGTHLGDTTYESYLMVKNGDTRNMSPDMASMVGFIDTEMEKIRKTGLKNGEMKPVESLKIEEQAGIYSRELSTRFKAMQMKPEIPLDENGNNPYKAPPLDAILTRPAFAKTPLAAILKKTREQNPSIELEPKDVIATAKAELKNGTAYNGSLEAATKDLTIYFNEAMKLNNEHYSFSKWGLPSQSQYGIDGKDWADRKTIVLQLAKAMMKTGQGLYYPDSPALAADRAAKAGGAQ